MKSSKTLIRALHVNVQMHDFGFSEGWRPSLHQRKGGNRAGIRYEFSLFMGILVLLLGLCLNYCI